MLGEPRGISCPIYASAGDALATECDVFVEYTQPDGARTNVIAAVDHGAHAVVGTSGLTEADFAEIDVAAGHTAGRTGGWQFRVDGRADAEVCRDRGQVHVAMGDHRLRA